MCAKVLPVGRATDSVGVRAQPERERLERVAACRLAPPSGFLRRRRQPDVGGIGFEELDGLRLGGPATRQELGEAIEVARRHLLQLLWGLRREFFAHQGACRRPGLLFETEQARMSPDPQRLRIHVRQQGVLQQRGCLLHLVLHSCGEDGADVLEVLQHGVGDGVAQTEQGIYDIAVLCDRDDGLSVIKLQLRSRAIAVCLLPSLRCSGSKHAREHEGRLGEDRTANAKVHTIAASEDGVDGGIVEGRKGKYGDMCVMSGHGTGSRDSDESCGTASDA